MNSPKVEPLSKSPEAVKIAAMRATLEGIRGLVKDELGPRGRLEGSTAWPKALKMIDEALA